MTLHLDTLAPSTLATVHAGHTVEASIKAAAGFDVETLRDLYRMANTDKIKFIVAQGAALKAEAAAAYEEAYAGRTQCDGGCRDGVRLLSGCIENGKFKGSTGKCFRCGGKGYQDAADIRRNRNYDNHYRRISA